MSDSPFNIQRFIHDLSDIPLSDMLCSLDMDSSKVIELASLPFEKNTLAVQQARPILKQAQEFRKEADINSLCAVRFLIQWKIEGNELLTPLFLYPVEWSVNKQKQELNFQCDEYFELNPFVKRTLRIWTNEETEFESLSTTEVLEKIKGLKDLHNLELELEERIFMGNFHYHRYHILRELEGIAKAESKSLLLDTLLGENTGKVEQMKLNSGLLTAADTDQLRVFDVFEEGNVVVQGPPGTGKSQVLVNLLGKLMSAKKRTLVVSEKRVALEVIASKLTDSKLNPFAFVVHSQTKSRDLLEHLKTTWLQLESGEEKYTPALHLSEQRFSQLQQLLDRLGSPHIVGGVSYNEFLELRKETPLENVAFRTDTPTIDEWLKHKNTVRALDIAVGGLNKLSGYKPVFFQLNHGDRKFKSWLETLALIKLVLPLHSLMDLEELYESLGRCQLVENEKYKLYTSLIGKPKEWKKFERNRLRLSEINDELDQQKAEIGLWKIQPSISEIETYETAKGYFAKSKIKRKLKSGLREKAVNLEIAIANWKKLEILRTEAKTLEAYFTGLELSPNSWELELGSAFVKSIISESQAKLAEVAGWTSEKRRAILNFQSQIENLYKDLQRYLILNDDADLEAAVYRLSQNFEHLFTYSSKIQSIPLSILNLFEEAGNWLNLQSLILFSNWRKTEALFPELIKFNGDLLLTKIENCLAEQDHDLSVFAQEIIHIQHKKFKENNALILKASQKCTPEEKERRIRLKRGKALLVKEFAKSRSHISVRELLDSDARIWIQDLLPVWLATPTQVADHFPLSTALFDVVVFDEASQIPLPNAFGAIYRSMRALVAGDEQQMSPTSYFGKKWSGHDLLHQALFYFKRAPLRHHYRSEHVDLIAFSNKHFYNNELLVYPSPERKQVLFSHFTENARFIERKNEIEAKELALSLKNADWSKRIGIVAFSEEQLKCIWNACDVKTQDLISDGQENNTVVFKALEQVQGDEADLLFVSLGYAKNEAGDFHLRFGPLNQSNGYKRLNVLLTRATREIHFFHSVSSADFGIVSNESVDLLRRFISDLESNQTISQLTFPHSLEPVVELPNKLIFENLTSYLPNAIELTTLIRVLKSRGWNPTIIN